MSLHTDWTDAKKDSKAKFKTGKGFTILGVSLDQRREAWKACWYAVESLAYSPDGTTLFAGCKEGTVEIFREGRRTDDDKVVSLPAHSGGVHHLALAPDGKLLASAGLAPDRTASSTLTPRFFRPSWRRRL